MKIIALEREKEGLTKKDFAPFLKDEAKHVYDLQKKGIIREIYFRADRKEAVLVLECNSVEEAENILNQFPLVKNNLIAFEIIPLTAYTGFERLFKTH
jgi:muconolactone delta-isomerase